MNQESGKAGNKVQKLRALWHRASRLDRLILVRERQVTVAANRASSIASVGWQDFVSDPRAFVEA